MNKLQAEKSHKRNVRLVRNTSENTPTYILQEETLKEKEKIEILREGRDLAQQKIEQQARNQEYIKDLLHQMEHNKNNKTVQRVIKKILRKFLN